MNSLLRPVKAFSLIEMLAVITIIIVLASIITPVVFKVRARAWQTTCIHNLKNLHGAAWNHAYDQDGDDRHLPRAESSTDQHHDGVYFERRGWVAYGNYNPGSKTAEQRWWGDEGKKSVTNGTIWADIGRHYDAYTCPTIQRWLKGKTSPNQGIKLTMHNVYRTYVMNDQAGHRNVTGIKNASKMVLFAEAHPQKDWQPAGTRMCERGWLQDHSDGYDSKLDSRRLNNNYAYESIGWWHYGRGNVVFIDGHTEALLWSDTTNACSGNW